ncbi:MAG: chromosomal replication initiator protein DnaA, partial [Paludibacteraceae bacterium]|nr:chromosomal replication initiator protein DnaA [Paludibacteraceae bacterium]
MLTRFKWGLVTELERPDYELRKAILNYKIRKDGLSISPEVVDYIATNVTDNIRDLEGSIVSLLAQSTFCNKKIDMKLAEKVVKNLIVIDSVQLTIEKITAIVCKHLGVNEDVLMSKTRQREIVLARQMSMYFSKKYTNQSQSTIGHVVAGRDHATVNHSIKTVSNLLATDRQFEYTLKEIEQKILHAK